MLVEEENQNEDDDDGCAETDIHDYSLVNFDEDTFAWTLICGFDNSVFQPLRNASNSLAPPRITMSRLELNLLWIMRRDLLHIG
jgi:hypothetical protein